MAKTQHGNGSCAEKFRSISQFKELRQETLDELNTMCRVLEYEPGQTLALEGEDPEYIGCVIQGILRMQKTLVDGRQHIVGLLVEGDMFGRVFNGPLHFAIEAASDAEICAFQRGPFEALLTRAPDLERVVMLNVLNELDRARDWMIVLSNQKITARLAGFFLVLCSRFATVDHLLRLGKDGLQLKIPISRADLAHLLGTRPESVSRAFHALEGDGLITIVKPNVVRIRDFEALAAEAGEEELVANSNLKEIVRILRHRL